MVSNFIEKHNGYLKLTDNEYDKAKDFHPGIWKEARQLLKIGANTGTMKIHEASIKSN